MRTRLSTRRLRFLPIKSALPIQYSSSPALVKWKMRECSRKRPRIDLTFMFSDSPGTPGLRAQIPRTTRSTGTPACDAS